VLESVPHSLSVNIRELPHQNMGLKISDTTQVTGQLRISGKILASSKDGHASEYYACDFGHRLRCPFLFNHNIWQELGKILSDVNPFKSIVWLTLVFIRWLESDARET
jgi:hypothetical protein